MARQFTDEDREKAIEARRKNKEQKLSPADNSSHLDILEKEMAQQLRIMNMHKMMMAISQPPAPAQQQMSSLKEMVSVFKDLNTIKEQVRSEVTEDDYVDEEPQSMEEKLIMQLLPSLLQNKQSIQPNAMKLPSNISEQQLRQMIKMKLLSKEQAKDYLAEYGIQMSEEEFNQRWEELSK